MKEIRVARCRACRRSTALTPLPYVLIYCSPTCAAEEYPAGDNEDRNDLIAALAELPEVNQGHLAGMFGVTRQAVSKILIDRDIKRDFYRKVDDGLLMEQESPV